MRGRDLRPFPEEELFDASLLQRVIGTPSNPGATEDVESLQEVPRAPVPRPDEEVSAPVVRRAILHRSYFERAGWGYTDGCPKCRSLKCGEDSSRGHVASCRKRIEGLMAKDPKLKLKLEAAEARADMYIAHEIERNSSKIVSSDAVEVDSA